MNNAQIQQIDSINRQCMNAYQINDMYVGVYSKGTTQKFHYGSSTQDSLYEIGSITKVFTGLLCAIDHTENKKSVYSTIENELYGGKTGTDVDSVKLVQLLTHTSGMPASVPPRIDTKNELLDHIKTLDLGRFPYNYSNIGIGIAGYITEAVNSTDYESLINDRINQPLKLQNTWVNVPQDKAHKNLTPYNNGIETDPIPQISWYAAGILKSSPQDMTKFMKKHLKCYTDEYTLPIKEAILFSQQQQVSKGVDKGIGLCWEIESSFMHKIGTTKGFSTVVAMDPTNQVGVVILTNEGKSKLLSYAKRIMDVVA